MKKQNDVNFELGPGLLAEACSGHLPCEAPGPRCQEGAGPHPAGALMHFLWRPPVALQRGGLPALADLLSPAECPGAASSPSGLGTHCGSPQPTTLRGSVQMVF